MLGVLDVMGDFQFPHPVTVLGLAPVTMLDLAPFPSPGLPSPAIPAGPAVSSCCVLAIWPFQSDLVHFAALLLLDVSSSSTVTVI